MLLPYAWSSYDPLYFRGYYFSQTLVKPVKCTRQEHSGKIEATGETCCGGDKIWPVCCRVGPSATRMYNLMVAVCFLKGKHPKNRWESAAARDLGIAIISQFNLREVGNEMEDWNAAVE